MEYILLLIVIITALLVVLAYSIRLQRRAVITQDAAMHEHQEGKTQRDRHFLLAEESIELQKRSLAQGEEINHSLKRSLELQEELLKELRNHKS
jgi:hypothetical protein